MSDHPTPPVAPCRGAALYARPLAPTGRRWMSWDEAMKATGQSAEYQGTPTLGDSDASANGYGSGIVARTPGT